jgi:protein-disulfide isomerase
MSSGEAPATLATPVGDHDHAQGAANAPVTLVEYGDYQCPYCGTAHTIVKRVQKEMGTQLRFVFRNFPLREAHPHALHAAIAAETVAAHGEDAFWKMHDALYEHQDALADDNLAAYAKSAGVPAREITQAFAGGPAADKVRSDFRGGIRSGVNGTPTFFINGERFDGNWSDVGAFVAALRAAAESGT